MLRTRLWVGAILIALALGTLVGDVYLAPWYPCLFVFLTGLALVGTHELIYLLGPARQPQVAVCYVGVFSLAVANWLVHLIPLYVPVWDVLAGILTGLLLIVFLYEMTRFTEPGRSVERMAATWFILGYLGWLPCFFAQLRWLRPVDLASHNDVSNSVGLALAIFVPKCCDIGAYFTGRLFGRHKMTPILSPKKTWEGAAGGLTLAALVAVAIDRSVSTPVLQRDLFLEVGFGLSVGLAGMLGDLAESLLKRDCQKKDASRAVPGFGGVLDIVDALLFAAPVAYLWLALVK